MLALSAQHPEWMAQDIVSCAWLHALRVFGGLEEEMLDLHALQQFLIRFEKAEPNSMTRLSRPFACLVDPHICDPFAPQIGTGILDQFCLCVDAQA